MRNTLKTLAVAIATFFGMALGASAATLTAYFDTHLSGADVGNTSLATLVAEDVDGGVRMTLTNTGSAAGIDSFDTRLFLAYAAPNDSSVGLTDISGVATTSFTTNVGDFERHEYDWQMLVAWGTSNRQNGVARLEIGESSVFLLTGATTDRLFGNSGSTPFALLHIQGVGDDAELSSQYGATPSPVPLPSAGWLLVAGLGGLAATRRRKKS